MSQGATPQAATPKPHQNQIKTHSDVTKFSPDIKVLGGKWEKFYYANVILKVLIKNDHCFVFSEKK